MKRRYMLPLLIVIVGMIVYWLGPQLPVIPVNTVLPVIPAGIADIEEYVAGQ